MLNHDQCISKITEMLECCEKFVIISLVQTDTWLIQNICYTYQSGTDLSRQTNSLCFSALQCSSCSSKCQIVQSDIHQKLDSGIDLFQDLSADQHLMIR